MKYYFDLDNTLIDTSALIPYRTTQAGMSFVANNPDKVETKVVDNRLVDMVRNIQDDVIILTNSPRGYAKALLHKHKFPELQIIGSSSKPHTILEGKGIIIGDEPIDVLTAQANKMPSIIFTQASRFPKNNLILSKPNQIASNFETLENALEQNFEFSQQSPRFKFRELSDEDLSNVEGLEIISIMDYHPSNSSGFLSNRDGRILRFKGCKDITQEEFDSGLRRKYFYQRIRQGLSYKEVYNTFLTNAKEKFTDLNIKGSYRYIEIPNSLPEFAYIQNINRKFANELNNGDFKQILWRTKPVPSAHRGGRRGLNKQIGNLAVIENTFLNQDNLVLFDDITTTGHQIYAAGALLRGIGYQGNIVGLTLGKTIKREYNELII